MEQKELVTLSNVVIAYLDELIITLYKENYFSYIEDSKKYVDKILFQLYSDLPNKTHYYTPLALIRFGNYYVKLKINKNTMWYAFFNKKENKYFVKYITNNHTSSAAFLNGL